MAPRDRARVRVPKLRDLLPVGGFKYNYREGKRQDIFTAQNISAFVVRVMMAIKPGQPLEVADVDACLAELFDEAYALRRVLDGVMEPDAFWRLVKGQVGWLVTTKIKWETLQDIFCYLGDARVRAEKDGSTSTALCEAARALDPFLEYMRSAHPAMYSFDKIHDASVEALAELNDEFGDDGDEDEDEDAQHINWAWTVPQNRGNQEAEYDSYSESDKDEEEEEQEQEQEQEQQQQPQKDLPVAGGSFQLALVPSRPAQKRKIAYEEYAEPLPRQVESQLAAGVEKKVAVRDEKEEEKDEDEDEEEMEWEGGGGQKRRRL